MHDQPMFEPALEAELALLEAEMPHLQHRNGNVFAMANAWAERYDAILSHTPPDRREQMQLRLLRIGIRWGVMNGKRMTTQFPALPADLTDIVPVR